MLLAAQNESGPDPQKHCQARSLQVRRFGSDQEPESSRKARFVGLGTWALEEGPRNVMRRSHVWLRKKNWEVLRFWALVPLEIRRPVAPEDAEVRRGTSAASLVASTPRVALLQKLGSYGFEASALRG